VCSPTPVIQEIVIPIQRIVTSHDDLEPLSSSPQPNDNYEAGNNENEDHQSENEDPQNNDAPAPPSHVRRSRRERKKAISDDYINYMSEDVNFIG
jgi:hypothetical protein